MMDWQYGHGSTYAARFKMRELLARSEEERRARLVRQPRSMRRRAGLLLIAWGTALVRPALAMSTGC